MISTVPESEAGDEARSQDAGGDVESGLGNSYVHGVQTRGPRPEDYLDEDDELAGGGVMGLLGQIYSNQRRAIG